MFDQLPILTPWLWSAHDLWEMESDWWRHIFRTKGHSLLMLDPHYLMMQSYIYLFIYLLFTYLHI